MNEEVNRIMLTRFGLSDLSLDNIEQVFNPLVTGFTSMAEARAHLIKRGMTAELADTLARKYINNQTQVYTVMDFFEGAKDSTAINALQKTPLS